MTPPPSPHRPAYAALIAYHRTRLGLSQLVLAERVGATREQVAAWEIGRYAPRAERVRRLAAALELALDDLLEALEA